jgi:hypothetical protein
VLDHPVRYIAGAGQNNRIVFGVLLELLLIIANIGTAVVIFPIVRRQSAAEGTVAYTLAAIKDWTFLLAELGGRVGKRADSRLPHVQVRVSGTLVLFGVAEKGGTLQGLATIPEALWELSLGIYCTLKGFRPSSPILRPDAREDRVAISAVTPA